MSLPNPLILFDAHFNGHRRHYPFKTRLAIATDLGYDGYEWVTIEPDDGALWQAAQDAMDASGLRRAGMYVVAKGVADDEAEELDAQIERLRRIIERLAKLAPHAYLNLTIGSNPSAGGGAFHETGSAHAEERHWQRAARLVRAADAMLAEHGMAGNLYNHVWFLTDTPQAELRVLSEAGAKVVCPGLATKHSHLHRGAPDLPHLLELPGMERLGYVALLNVLPAPAPFRTVPIDEGQIDIAGWLAHLWARHYRGPLVMQAYDLGGDSYATARRCRDYVQEIRARFERNPALNPAVEPSWREIS